MMVMNADVDDGHSNCDDGDDDDDVDDDDGDGDENDDDDDDDDDDDVISGCLFRFLQPGKFNLLSPLCLHPMR